MLTINDNVPNSIKVNGYTCTKVVCNRVTVWEPPMVEIGEMIDRIPYDDNGNTNGPYFTYSGDLIPGHAVTITLIVPLVESEFATSSGKIAHWSVSINVDGYNEYVWNNITDGEFTVEVTPDERVEVYGNFLGWK